MISPHKSQLQNKINQLLIASLLAGLASSPGIAYASSSVACADIDFKDLRSLQFGFLRIRRGVTGWAVVDASGGAKVSPGIAFSNRFPPSPGAVQVTGPPNTEVLMGIYLTGNTSLGPLTMDQPMALTENGMFALKRVGQFWSVRLPNSDRETVSIDIAIGGQLIIQNVEKKWEISTKIVTQCISARLVPPP